MHLHLDEDRTVKLKNDPLANRTQYAFIGDRRRFLTVGLAALAASTSIVRAKRNGAPSFRRLAFALPVRRAPKQRIPASTLAIMRTGYIAAFAATRRCMTPKPSTSRGRDGPASGKRSQR